MELATVIQWRFGGKVAFLVFLYQKVQHYRCVIKHNEFFLPSEKREKLSGKESDSLFHSPFFLWMNAMRDKGNAKRGVILCVISYVCVDLL